jgi:hypothetical protein
MGYRADVANPLHREAEDRFERRAIAEFGAPNVLDRRPEFGACDFRILPRGERAGIVWDCDVKCDQLAHQTKRIPFEERHVYPDGTYKLGWGYCDDLDYVVFVLPHGGWRALWFRVRSLKAHVEDRLHHAQWWDPETGEEVEGAPAGWARISNAERNTERGYRTEGWAIPLREVRELIHLEWDLSGVERPSQLALPI